MGIGRVCRRLAVEDEPGGREITDSGLGAGAERRHEDRYHKWTVWFRFTGGGSGAPGGGRAAEELATRPEGRNYTGDGIVRIVSEISVANNNVAMALIRF